MRPPCQRRALIDVTKASQGGESCPFRLPPRVYSADVRRRPQPTDRAVLIRRLLPLVVVVLLAGVAYLALGEGGLSLEALVRHRMTIDGFVTEHRVLAVLAYIALYITAVALSVPGAVFLTVAGGFLFGLVIGASAAVIGATIGATLIFLVARTALGRAVAAAGRAARHPARARFPRRRFQLSSCFCGWCRRFRSSWSIWCRPLPACGWRRLSPRPRSAIIPGALVYAFAGTGLDSVIAAQKNSHQPCLAAGGADCRMTFRCQGCPDAAIDRRAGRARSARVGAGGGEKTARALARAIDFVLLSRASRFKDKV